ncbi:MAG: DinB family protein [Acidobacteria bacterium]|nr:DinB family protein [Acidobacteriota bacterium]
MSESLPEPWLRGPVPDVPALLQPAAHALIMSMEDCAAAVASLTADELWLRPGGVASVGFHLQHLAGSTERLLTYARGERLTLAQLTAMQSEGQPGEPPASGAALVDAWRAAVDRAIAQMKATPESSLTDRRTVGRAQLPSTVLGLIFHAAEHASRHTGQVVTTAKVVASPHW